ncbi:Spo0B domain-containing protein [Alkalibacillus silvisoli]|uniref:SpoOB alpha-helical domain-containing protein n=1 Tax=Alkalibacillus silvisoli TaxID=392823 RepID=A0ABN0ZRZ1_9BACI
MNQSDFLEWLRLYRHELMNDLQIIQGYATMGKYEKSNDKINQLVERLKHERQLQTLNADQFVNWLLTVSLSVKQLDISYTIETSKTDLADVDDDMKLDSELVINYLLPLVGEFDVIPVQITISGEDRIQLLFEIELLKEKQHDLINSLKTKGILSNTTNDNCLSLTIKY